MKEHAVQVDCTGPQACFRSHVRGICCECDKWASPIHSPINRRGVFCEACCPCCGQNTAQSSGNGPTLARSVA